MARYSRRRLYGFVCLFLVSCFLIQKRTRTNEDCLSKALSGPLSPDNDELLEYIRNKFLIRPSDQPYNLAGNRNRANLAIEESEKFYRTASDILFENKRKGFFIEAGALDGESMSNTLTLEIQKEWSGLLIEADPVSFQAMVKKHRKAWLANVCVSPDPYPKMAMFSMKSQFFDPDIAVSYGFKMRAMHGLTGYTETADIKDQWVNMVQCIPLESILLAIGVHRVDLLSLDVEGVEMKILQHFPFNKFDIQVIYLEYRTFWKFEELRNFMAKKGYIVFRHQKDDTVFVKKGSRYEPKILSVS